MSIINITQRANKFAIHTKYFNANNIAKQFNFDFITFKKYLEENLNCLPINYNSMIYTKTIKDAEKVKEWFYSLETSNKLLRKI